MSATGDLLYELLEEHEWGKSVLSDEMLLRVQEVVSTKPPEGMKPFEEQSDSVLVENLAQFAEDEGFVGSNVNAIKRELKKRLGIESNTEVVWENECQLVIGRTAGHKIEGDMGLCHEGEEIRVNISSVDYSGKHEIFEKLSDAPVRISIRRVPGGRV